MEDSPEIVYHKYLILGSLGMLMLTTAISVFIYLFQRKLIKRKLAYKEIEDLLKKQELKSAYAILEGQEKERRRIAEDLHDNLGSMLVTLNMYADILVQDKRPDEQQRIAEKISVVTAQATEETRRLSHSLHTGLLKHFGLQTALQELVHVVKESKSLDVTLYVDVSDAIDKEIAINIYRIIQELINNTLKHANAKFIRLEITAIENEYINVIYEDDGIGFSQHTRPTGMGLQNIISRATRMKGQVNIQSEVNKGTTVIIEIPLDEKD